jgi:CDP-glycerol glycerophosphotransferase
VLHSRSRLEQHSVPLEVEPGAGRFEARVEPARIRTLGGELPLREGTWHLHVRSAEEHSLVPLLLAQTCYPELPLSTVVGHKACALGVTPEQQATIAARRDLAADERGGFHQRRLRETVYVTGRARALCDTVVYSSFDGRQYSCNPRAIHEELVRREAPLEHLWVVRDGMCRVPDGAGLLRRGSREYYEALARSRFVVTNDHLPDWFERRGDQVCLQTWHGTPLKLLGRDLLAVRPGIGRAIDRWDRQARNWLYVLSQNPHSTAVLGRAYAMEGEIFETGYPRDDVLAGGGRDDLRRQVRERLGLAESARVVLYAPTFREQHRDSRGRFRLNLQIDLDRLRQAIGPDTFFLIRKHHRVAEVIAATGNGFVRDVSTYPDGTELLLAADVLVTDYSSLMFDYANTGRPMLFFTYDLDAYRDQVRGLYLDMATEAPGPLVQTTDELAAALNDLDAVRADYGARYREFVDRFCALDDGGAAARVVDRVFS